MKTTDLTILIYSYNNEADIVNCIKSSKPLTSNILLVDLQSQDRTLKLAKSQDVLTVTHPTVTVVEEVREFGIQKVQTQWVFILDADERMTPELVHEILAIDQENPATHYIVPRKEIFAHKVWLKHGGWWPNYQTRLFQKDALVQWPKVIHSAPKFEGIGGTLSSPFLHYSQNDWSDNVEKTIRFESTEAQLLYEAGKNVSTATFFRKYFGEMYRRLLMNGGFLDGQFGVIESLYQAYSKTITYLFLYEKKKKSA